VLNDSVWSEPNEAIVYYSKPVNPLLPGTVDPLILSTAIAIPLCVLMRHTVSFQLIIESPMVSKEGKDTPSAGIVVIASLFHRILNPSIPLSSVTWASQKELRHHLLDCMRHQTMKEFPYSRTDGVQRLLSRISLRRDDDSTVSIRTRSGPIRSTRIYCPKVCATILSLIVIITLCNHLIDSTHRYPSYPAPTAVHPPSQLHQSASLSLLCLMPQPSYVSRSLSMLVIGSVCMIALCLLRILPLTGVSPRLSVQPRLMPPP
jgi:hypothetical protein